jgi:hypothetical protein
MGLGSQFTQGQFGTLHRLALGAESRITQSRTPLFAEIPSLTAVTTGAAIAKTVTCTTWPPVATWARTAFTRTAIATSIASACRLGFLLTWAIISAHGDDRFSGFDHHRGDWDCLLSRRVCCSRFISQRAVIHGISR